MTDEKQPVGAEGQASGAGAPSPEAEAAAGREATAAAGAGAEHGRRRHRAHDAEARVKDLEKAQAEKEQELAARQAEAREYLEGWQRERANFENFRKRMARELDDAGIVAKVELIRAVLPAMDNLERALGDNTADVTVVRKGVQLTYDQLRSALEKHGLTEVPAAGQPFDPNVHEAIGAVEGTEHAPDTVVEDLQKGYTFGERLVRPARVRVAR